MSILDRAQQKTIDCRCVRHPEHTVEENVQLIRIQKLLLVVTYGDRIVLRLALGNSFAGSSG
jgi:hypothetical protein